MDEFKSVVFLVAVLCGFVFCIPGNTCETGDSAVSQSDGKGLGIRIKTESVKEYDDK